MPNYTVSVDAIYTTDFSIEADSQEDAQKKSEDYVNKNNLPFQLSKGSIEIAHIEQV